MSGTREFKERIASLVPIEVYIGRYVALKKQGRYFKGLCPFHNEKSPSFTVTPEKGLFHCFGCGKGGDLFTFVMEMEGASFSEAMEILARFAGIEVPRGSGKKDNRLDDLARLNAKVMHLYSSHLNSPEGIPFLNYLKSRGISEASQQQFQMGAAPDRWRFLESSFSGEKKELLELGLLKESGGSIYDFFRGRIIFPIQDLSGRVAGFGGRALPGRDKEAKYINSPDSPLFHKGTILYGLYQSLQAIREKREALIVEGYLDVVGLHQAGIRNAVAPLGTALTPDHLKLIQRYTDRLLLLLDGDRAGRAAALKFARLAADHGGIRASVVVLPPGQDPFDLASGSSAEEIRLVLEKRISSDRYLLMETIFPERFAALSSAGPGSLPAADYGDRAIEYYQKGIVPPAGLEEKRAGLQRLFEFLRSVGRSTDRELFLDEGARILGLTPSAVRTEWGRAVPVSGNGASTAKGAVSSGSSQEIGASGPVRQREAGENVSARRMAGSVPDRKAAEPMVRCERLLLLEFLTCPPCVGRFATEMADFEFLDQHAEFLWRFLESRYLTGETWTAGSLPAFDLPRETIAAFAGLVIEREEGQRSLKGEESNLDPAHMIEELILDHSIRGIKLSLEQIKREMTLADPSSVEELTLKRYEMTRRMKELESHRGGKKK